MDQDSFDFELTFFRGKVRFQGGDAQISHYELADSSARITVPNNIHVRLIEQIKMPPVYEIIAPRLHVMVESGTIPESYQIRQKQSYYRALEARYVPLQLADLQKYKTPAGRIKKAGCLMMLALFVATPVVLWMVL